MSARELLLPKPWVYADETMAAHVVGLEHRLPVGGARWTESSAIYGEFERDLAAWRIRYTGKPAQEMLHLYLLALEREENVAVAYNEKVLGPRLDGLPVPPEVREVMRRALVRVCRDEEMHTAYVRRVLIEAGNPVVRARTWLQGMTGALGGWTVAVRQHARWSAAPLSRTVATLFLWAGELTGRVPQTVRRHLSYCSFREFCRYNVETESTAWLCWQRITDLATCAPSISNERVSEFRRIAEDEDRHRRVFSLIADCLDDDDRLRENVAGEIRALQEFI